MTHIDLLDTPDPNIEELMSQLDATRPERKRNYVICIGSHEPRMQRALMLRALVALGTEKERAILLVDAHEEQYERRHTDITALIHEFPVIESPTICLKMGPEREQRSFGPVYHLPNSSRHKAKMQRQQPRHKRY